MRAGVLGIVRDDFEVVDSFSETVERNDRELEHVLDVRRVFSLPGGDVAFEGRAAVERVVNRTTTELDYGEVRVEETPRTETRVTEVVGVPGEFVVAGSGRGTFAFDLVSRDTGADIERATLDLSALLDAQRDAEPWKAGFREVDGACENGVLHGSDLLSDERLEDLLDGAAFNQLGLDCTYDDRSLKMTAAESGYVEVYRPSEFETAEFLQYLRDAVVPHAE
ncbi:hypothetical protein M0R89_08895 [Halorussus limi]|uniref:Uncharacterized protein n=1 Tax=Halorussus limi TaxID=2938695 RepID=A0A8U0HYC2_9EURY|nr:hypothetical protein [Halorussus limi]UPV76155.1 hypothetical protein M0R89_08895 [Halorussus limi]